MSSGNFDFVKNIDSRLYRKLCDAEKTSRTDFETSGHNIRKALEIIVGIITEHTKIDGVNLKKLDLKSKLDLLQEIGILPDLGKVKFTYENEKIGEADYYIFMRRYGNACSHQNNNFISPKICYENTVKCLKGCHLLLQCYYKEQIPDRMQGFDENIMPIEEYHVIKSYVPNDKVRSKCEREFLAYIENSEGEKDFYAVLRLYRKTDIYAHFLQRNHKCFVEASKESIITVPEGMAKMREVTSINSDKSTFYIISYIFNREPHELNQKVLREMSLEQRIKLCSRITDCMYNLHTSKVPIEHRMLNYECIFVCRFRNEWIPYIIKFDFAKIEAQAIKRTVFENAVKAKDKLKDRRLSKYLPPEWEVMLKFDDIDWTKVDIYSLGVLFSDILAGEIRETLVTLDELEELEVSEEILELLDLMRADEPKARFGIQKVKEIFDSEVRG